jgi:hypothetical protein
MNKHLTLFAVLSVFAAAGACANERAERQASATSQAVGQQAEQHIASVKNSQSQEAAYYASLATATTRESRNEAWAMDMEAKLQNSYAAATHVPPKGLKSVKCYSSKCVLEIQLDRQQAQASVEQQQAINEWIAWSQPCGYDLIAQSSELLRVFVNCSK